MGCLRRTDSFRKKVTVPLGKRPIIADALDIAGWLALALVVVGLVFDRGPLDSFEPFGIFAALMMMGMSKIIELLNKK